MTQTVKPLGTSYPVGRRPELPEAGQRRRLPPGDRRPDHPGARGYCARHGIDSARLTPTATTILSNADSRPYYRILGSVSGTTFTPIAEVADGNAGRAWRWRRSTVPTGGPSCRRRGGAEAITVTVLSESGDVQAAAPVG